MSAIAANRGSVVHCCWQWMAAYCALISLSVFITWESSDIEQWYGATLQELSHAALDRQRWAATVTMASDTNGH